MKLLLEMEFDGFDTHHLLHVLSHCEELQTDLRRSEKKLLNELHSQCRFRIKSELAKSKVKVQEPWQKAFVLMQAAIGGLTLGDYTMRQQVRVRGEGLKVRRGEIQFSLSVLFSFIF